MIRNRSQLVELAPSTPAIDHFESDVLSGLSAAPKHLSCKYFYDQRGSKLFDSICELDEYYLTRCELEIMQLGARQMGDAMGAGAMLIEYGSGSSIKTRLLLDQLRDLAAYVPVDISHKHLHAAAQRLSRVYPHVEVLPVAADFTDDFDLPSPFRTPARRIAYFPGSTIGNFQPQHAVNLLSRIANTCGAGGGLLVGIDLQKDVSTIQAAYNDAQGITAQFNLNLLRRINRELGANFHLDQFRHLAFYDHLSHRMDIRLVSCCDQTVEVGPRSFDFIAGEPIQTEFSHKYTIQQFNQMASGAGFGLRQYWTDPRQYFAVLYFEVESAPAQIGTADSLQRIRRRPR